MSLQRLERCFPEPIMLSQIYFYSLMEAFVLVEFKGIINLFHRNYRKWSATDNPHSRNVTSSDQQLPYREYMPAVWQVMPYG